MPPTFSSLRGALVGCCAILAFGSAGATGVQPDSSIVQLSADTGRAQMAVRNTDTTPLMMNVKVLDLPGSESITVLPVPNISLIQPDGRQVVQFMFADHVPAITKQYFKRVSFVGIPPRSDHPGGGAVTVNVRQIIPMVISPPGLVQDNEPWKRLQIVRVGDDAMELRNDSPFVVRLHSGAALLPMKAAVELMKNTYVLPGEHLAVDLPRGVRASAVQSVRIGPVSPWGYEVSLYDIAVRDAPPP